MNSTKSVYAIKKIMTFPNGKRSHVLLTDNHSEILELTYKNIAINLAKLMQENSDSGWTYEVIEIKNKIT
jgi:hypothetical protein